MGDLVIQLIKSNNMIFKEVNTRFIQKIIDYINHVLNNLTNYMTKDNINHISQRRYRVF